MGIRPGQVTTRSPRSAFGPGADLSIARIVALLLILLPIGAIGLVIHEASLGPSPAAEQIATFDPHALLGDSSPDFLPTPVAAIPPDANAAPPAPAADDQATTNPAGEQVKVANTGGIGAVLRASPPSGKQVAALRDGTLLQVIERQTLPDGSEWLHVTTPDGTQGWVYSKLVAPAN